MTTKEIMQRAAAALDDKRGKDITVLKIADVSTLADYFLICTGTSSTQIRALCDAVEEAMD
ncbi:MAG: RsfS/YbeB/iojap family protein, partial [Oscillospiraceae bacterium]|nr:RsfS/YbeB/iojap family protein [Oscillospiraceae bacterium]